MRGAGRPATHDPWRNIAANVTGKAVIVNVLFSLNAYLQILYYLYSTKGIQIMFLRCIFSIHSNLVWRVRFWVSVYQFRVRCSLV